MNMGEDKSLLERLLEDPSIQEFLGRVNPENVKKSIKEALAERQRQITQTINGTVFSVANISNYDHGSSRGVITPGRGYSRNTEITLLSESPVRVLHYPGGTSLRVGDFIEADITYKNCERSEGELKEEEHPIEIRRLDRATKQIFETYR